MPRKVRVTTTSFAFPNGRTVEQNREQAVRFLDAAGSNGSDLACLPETFPQAGIAGDAMPAAEPLEGETFAALAAAAKKHAMWVVGGYFATAGDAGIENIAAVIDRDGRLAGHYSKVHPTISEMRRYSVLPGRGPLVVDTDFGRVGVAICYDFGWPALWSEMRDAGADLVVWPSAYGGGLPLQAYAWMHGYHIVSAVLSEHSRIIDISGSVVASTSRWQRMATATIDLEKELLHIAPSLGQHEKLFRLQEELGGRVTIQGFTEENFVTLESNDPDWPVARLKAHYGLVNNREYHELATQLQDEARPARDAAEATAGLARR